MAKELKAGDLVELKSGGPTMTVKGRVSTGLDNSTTIYICQWFGGKKLESGQFHVDSLKTVELKTQ
jgi:uncharacterized protein YodC (DUF2158 family)